MLIRVIQDVTFAGKNDDSPTTEIDKIQNSEHRLEINSSSETVSLDRALLLNLILQINPAKATIYRSVEPQYFKDPSEKIVASMYRSILSPLDERQIEEVIEFEDTIIEELEVEPYCEQDTNILNNQHQLQEHVDGEYNFEAKCSDSKNSEVGHVSQNFYNPSTEDIEQATDIIQTANINKNMRDVSEIGRAHV